MVRAIVLASSSRYRKELLTRLDLPFTVDTAAIDETAPAGEAPRATALRLSVEKARAVAPRHPTALVIGSDQVAELEGRAIGKPGNHARALEQLESMQGNRVNFFSGIALVDAASGRYLVDCIATEVRFRKLTRAALEAYLDYDRPYDCAGAAKIESLGISLVEQVRSDDPTALIGLPLICLTTMLAQMGVHLPAH
jgi:septum formation protein